MRDIFLLVVVRRALWHHCPDHAEQIIRRSNATNAELAGRETTGDMCNTLSLLTVAITSQAFWKGCRGLQGGAGRVG
ncbi:hypothetical protein SAMN05414139_02780 [Burkholderia sp. D7]|nr:hypothetical protein SAMN05414139_02780 [Burkholderia sp. D7]